MTDPAFSPDPPPPATPLELAPAPPERPRKKGNALIAWIWIVAVVVFLLRSSRESVLTPGDRPGGRPSDDLVLRLQGQYAVGVAELFGQAERTLIYKQLEGQDAGSVGQRLRFAVLAGELAGPEEAVRRLDNLRTEIAVGDGKEDPDDVTLVPVLERLYQGYEQRRLALLALGASTVGLLDSPPERGALTAASALVPGRPRGLDASAVPAEQRERLRQRLGWFGELALAPRDGPDPEARAAVLAPALRTALILVSGITVLAAAALVGFCALVVFLVLLFAGKLRDGLPGPYQYGGVYAEAFALWIALYVGLSLAAPRLHLRGPPLLLAGAMMLLCLVLGLLWPLFRGVPWDRLRRDAGLTFGRTPPLEPLLGVACYVMNLPLLAVGVVLTLGLLHLQKYLKGHGLGGHLEPQDLPTHPVVGVMNHMDWLLLLQLLLVASVLAPLVEETMFRGLLYRHLRELTGRWGRPLSTLAGALVVSFLFALIHPQGWTAIPALMALAIGFSLMREWRGTLIPSMVAHGINNGLIMLFIYFAQGG
jgi:membrane protease YdiL (CAAX protease family)